MWWWPQCVEKAPLFNKEVLSLIIGQINLIKGLDLILEGVEPLYLRIEFSRQPENTHDWCQGHPCSFIGNWIICPHFIYTWTNSLFPSLFLNNSLPYN